MANAFIYMVTLFLCLFSNNATAYDKSQSSPTNSNPIKSEELSPLMKEEQRILIQFGSGFAHSIKIKFPNTIIVGACSGSFENDSHDEKVVGLFDPPSNKLRIFVTLENGFFSLIQEQSKKIATRDDFEIQCMSAMEAKRRDRSFKSLEGIHGSIKPVSQMDVYCYFPNETTSECRGYDEKSKKWQVIGGWST